MIGDCPKCGLTNPPEAVFCDCGYNFETGTIDRSRAPKKGPAIAPSPTAFLLAMFCILGGIVACGSGVLSNFSLHGQGFGELDLVTMMIALGGLVAGIVGVCILCLIGRNS